ncbi:MAG: PilZ domain-containing protein, partial [Thermoanaerobaculia bacterium]
MRKRRTALAVIRSDDFYDTICSSCKRFADRFDRVVNAQRARIFTTNNFYNLILVEHPLEGLDNLTFLTSLRSTSSLCRNSPIISFSGDPAELAALKSLSGSTRESLPLDSRPYEISQAVIRLLSMSVRSPIEILVQMVVKENDKKLLLACQTKNLSSTGMLLRTSNNLPEGTELDFTFNLPNDERTIQGTAKVVRRAFQKSERIEGMGVLFTNLDGESSKSITDFVKKKSVLPAPPVAKKIRSTPPPVRDQSTSA